MGTKVDVGRLQSISNRLGDAVIDPAMWPALMQDICSASNSASACLLQSDVRTPDVPMTESGREFFKSYFDNRFHENDIRAARAVPLLLAGRQIVSDQDIFSSETEMLRDPLYAHANNFGLRWFAAVGFFAGSALWGFSIQRTIGEGAFEESEKAALAALSQRLTETATLSTAVGRGVLSGITNALAFIKRAAIALDRFGSVIDINPSAEAALGGDIRIIGQRLVISDRRAQATFNNFLDRLRTASDVDALGVAPIVVRRAGKPPIVVRVLPVDGAARSPFLGARAILILSGFDEGEAEQLAMLRQAFHLTPSEARITLCLAGGKSLEEVAQEMAIAHETARSHLKAIFRKTETHRQGELIALVSRLR
ncbi:helix-turn-helix transcriptional regulator [Bradyrhizobium sp. AUGA SZCCT0222]|uniref:helix-turn-helix transcriptional regulator n=1 Tax=Bradyrhizobium sp. AUGA SZCCT0222 TaxID=2807668 RepID=UPI001BA4F4C4|nr:helix-turn-helix transcriptional regulator [Bradyrhizobium sp. AUGA SZCCT0222]MBR1267948.1 helix-turn-helix transcriptional regulator [Bradyrhizobium sp. AUGA SZCCT0222]